MSRASARGVAAAVAWAVLSAAPALPQQPSAAPDASPSSFALAFEADAATEPTVLLLRRPLPEWARPLGPETAQILIAAGEAVVVGGAVLAAIDQARGTGLGLPPELQAPRDPLLSSARPTAADPAAATVGVRTADLLAAAEVARALRSDVSPAGWLQNLPIPRMGGPILFRVELRSEPTGAALHLGDRRTDTRSEAVRWLAPDDFGRGRLVMEGYEPCPLAGAVVEGNPRANQYDPRGVVVDCRLRR